MGYGVQGGMFRGWKLADIEKLLKKDKNKQDFVIDWTDRFGKEHHTETTRAKLNNMVKGTRHMRDFYKTVEDAVTGQRFYTSDEEARKFRSEILKGHKKRRTEKLNRAILKRQLESKRKMFSDIEDYWKKQDMNFYDAWLNNNNSNNWDIAHRTLLQNNLENSKILQRERNAKRKAMDAEVAALLGKKQAKTVATNAANAAIQAAAAAPPAAQPAVQAAANAAVVQAQQAAQAHTSAAATKHAKQAVAAANQAQAIAGKKKTGKKKKKKLSLSFVEGNI